MNAIQYLKDVDIRTIDPAELVDIRDVLIKQDLPKPERMIDFIRQIRNPYCFKCGKIVVKVRFADTDVTLDDRMESYLRTL